MKDIKHPSSDRRSKLIFGEHPLHASTFRTSSLQTLSTRHYDSYFTDENTHTYKCEILT